MKRLLALSLAIIVLGALTQSKSIEVEDQVQVQVYYETLCPDSIQFIVRQLYPAYYALGSKRIKLELVPAGRAKEEDVNGTKTFTCQHGPHECYGNKAHACVNSLTDIDTTMNFVYCSERSDVPTDNTTLKECAEEIELAWADLEDCIADQGDDLLRENAKKTDLAQPPFIPTIVLDGNYTQENQDQSLKHFKKLICKLIGDTDVECLC